MRAVEDMLRRRGYAWSATAEAALEALPETFGVYALFANRAEASRALGVWVVRDPWLRTDAVTRLASPAIAAQSPTLLAYRVLEPAPGEGVLRHHARLVAEQAEIVEALRRQP